MPQLDKFMFFNQYLWFTFFFMVLYCLFLFMILPLVFKMLKVSKKKFDLLEINLNFFELTNTSLKSSIASYYNSSILNFYKTQLDLLSNVYFIQYLNKKY